MSTEHHSNDLLLARRQLVAAKVVKGTRNPRIETCIERCLCQKVILERVFFSPSLQYRDADHEFCTLQLSEVPITEWAIGAVTNE